MPSIHVHELSERRESVGTVGHPRYCFSVGKEAGMELARVASKRRFRKIKIGWWLSTGISPVIAITFRPTCIMLADLGDAFTETVPLLNYFLREQVRGRQRTVTFLPVSPRL